MKVTITDTNDNSPVFNPTFYQASIQENVALETLAAVVDASDADPGINGKITYEITGGNVDDAFEINDPTVRLEYDLQLLNLLKLNFFLLL